MFLNKSRFIRVGAMISLLLVLNIVSESLVQADSQNMKFSTTSPKILNLCSVLPKSLALLRIPSPGACVGDNTSGGISSSNSSGSAGYSIPPLQSVILNRYYVNSSLLSEIDDVKAKIMQYSPSGVTEPKGAGQYAMSDFISYGKVKNYDSAWVSGPYEYTLNIMSPKVTQAIGLQVTKLIAHVTS